MTVHCPHCLFPMMRRPETEAATATTPSSRPSSRTTLTECTNCQAVIRVEISTVQPPSERWLADGGRRKNLGMRHTYDATGNATTMDGKLIHQPVPGTAP